MKQEGFSVLEETIQISITGLQNCIKKYKERVKVVVHISDVDIEEAGEEYKLRKRKENWKHGLAHGHFNPQAVAGEGA